MITLYRADNNVNKLYLDGEVYPMTIVPQVLDVEAMQAAGTLTLTGAPGANKVFTLNGVAFMAKLAGATGDEFNIGVIPTDTAANIVAAVNASVSVGVADVITASSVAEVVTFKADVPGAAGNALTLTEDLTNVTRTVFAGGVDGSVFTTGAYWVSVPERFVTMLMNAGFYLVNPLVLPGTFFGGLHMRGFTSSAAEASATQVPHNKDLCIHWNTVANTIKLAYNKAGSIIRSMALS